MSAEPVPQPKELIRQFILTTFLPGESSHNLRDDTSLLTSGILDSLAALQLISFLEQRFEIELDVYETTAEHFDCIEDIAACVVRNQVQRLQR